MKLFMKRTRQFPSVSLHDVKKEVLNLNLNKSSTSGTILVTIFKQTIDITIQHLTNAVYTAKKVILMR